MQPSINAVVRDLRLISESLNLLIDDPEAPAVKTKTSLEMNIGGSWKRTDTGEGEIIFTVTTIVDAVSESGDSDILKYKSVHRLALNVMSITDIPDRGSPPIEILGTYLTPALVMAFHRAEHALLSLGLPTRLALTPEFQAKVSAAAFASTVQKTVGSGSKKVVAAKRRKKKSVQP